MIAKNPAWCSVSTLTAATAHQTHQAEPIWGSPPHPLCTHLQVLVIQQLHEAIIILTLRGGQGMLLQEGCPGVLLFPRGCFPHGQLRGDTGGFSSIPSAPCRMLQPRRGCQGSLHPRNTVVIPSPELQHRQGSAGFWKGCWIQELRQGLASQLCF